MPVEAPTDEVLSHIVGPTSIRYSRVEIYQSDGNTPFYDTFGDFKNTRLVDGTVNVDYDNDERRTLDLELDNKDRGLLHSPDGFWYDKILKTYSGIKYYSQANYESIVVADNPDMYWRFGATTDSVLDHSGNNYTGAGSVIASPGFLSITSGPLLIGSNQALAIKSLAGIVGPTPSGDLAAAMTAYTAECWVKFTSVGADQIFFCRPASTKFYMGFITGQWECSVNTGTQVKVRSTVPPVANKWYHVVFVYTGSTATLYINSVPVASAAVTGTVAADTTPLQVGYYRTTGTTYGFSGVLDEVAFYNTSLSPSQIQDHYSSATMPELQEQEWEVQVGEFMIDTITETNMPRTLKITGRDYTKKCMLSQFTAATQFAATQKVEDVIAALAGNCGITKMILPVTGKTLGVKTLFDIATPRWDAMKQITDSFGYELFFDAQGWLVMREYKDPINAPEVYTLGAGRSDSNIVTWSKATSDSQIFNHILVYGESSDDSIAPVSAQAINNEPSSPTCVARLGDRVYAYSSSLITTTAQAQKVATQYLTVNALEEYDMTVESIVFVWWEAGDIIKIHLWDEDAEADPPTRFLLSSFAIPLKLGTMSISSKRVTVIK